jgi:D-alanyl-D-alanine carboxypeptidase
MHAAPLRREGLSGTGENQHAMERKGRSPHPPGWRVATRAQATAHRRRLVQIASGALAIALLTAQAASADGTPIPSREPAPPANPPATSAAQNRADGSDGTAATFSRPTGVQLAELARTNGLAPPPPPGGNGRLPFSQQVAIHSPRGPAYLAPNAARAWEAMRQASLRELGVELYPFGADSAYRSYAKQVEAWRVFKAGGPEAAPPGTSAHGLGRAVDLASFEMRKAVDRLGPRFGWAKTEVPSEWGHVNYVGG